MSDTDDSGFTPPLLSARIYCLIDPRDDSTFYVGKTIQPLFLRKNQHIQETRRKNKNSLRSQRVREILLSGLKPIIRLLEQVPESEWIEAEARWTVRLSLEGHVLLNALNQVGSGGSRSYSVEWTAEIQDKLGKVADSVLAQELGVTRKAVSYRREVLGVEASYDRTRNTPPPYGRKFQAKILPENTIERLGQLPDYVLGAEIGVCKAVIARARKVRGIISYAERTGCHGRYKPGNFPSRWLKRC